MSSRGPVTNGSRPTGTAMPTGVHCPPTNRSVCYGWCSLYRASNSAWLMLSQRGPSPSQDLDSEHGTGSNDQTKLNRYKRLYSQAREDLDNLKGQAKRRYILFRFLLQFVLTELNSQENCKQDTTGTWHTQACHPVWWYIDNRPPAWPVLPDIRGRNWWRGWGICKSWKWWDWCQEKRVGYFFFKSPVIC